MADPIELAEELGVLFPVVKRAAARLSIRGVDKGHSITPQDADRLRAAIGASRRSAPAPNPKPRPPAAVPERPAPAAQPPEPAIEPAPPAPDGAQLDTYYRRKHGEALAHIAQLEAELAAARAAAAAPEPPTAQPVEPRPEVAPEPVSAVFERHGLGHAPAAALAGLLARDAIAQRVVEALTVADARALEKLVRRYLAPLCDHADCRRLARAKRLVAVDAPAAACRICAGRSVKRAAALLIAACEAAEVGRLLIVGGSPNARTELQSLFAGAPVRLQLVEGDSKATLRVAKRHVANADLVVIWCNTILDHTTSEPYVAAGKAAGVRCVYPERRGIEALADAVRRGLGDPAS